MFKKKCPGCREKVEKKFRYCPYCGISFRQNEEKEDFGMLGKEDFMPELEQELNQGFRMPFGIDKIMNSLIKQLEKEMNNAERNSGSQGFKIQISAGNPQSKKMPAQQEIINLSNEEAERRRKLPRTEAESNIRRLSDRIVYEVNVPGVKSGKDVIITKLEDSIEIKAYSKDKCFVKVIPFKVEVIGYYLKDNTLFLELKD